METFFWTLPVSNLYLWVLADGFGTLGGWPDCSLMVNLFGDQALKITWIISWESLMRYDMIHMCMKRKVWVWLGLVINLEPMGYADPDSLNPDLAIL